MAPLSDDDLAAIRGYRDAGVLTARQAQVLELRYVDGYSIRGAARALGVTAATVHGAIARSHQKIRLHDSARAPA